MYFVIYSMSVICPIKLIEVLFIYILIYILLLFSFDLCLCFVSNFRISIIFFILFFFTHLPRLYTYIYVRYVLYIFISSAIIFDAIIHFSSAFLLLWWIIIHSLCYYLKNDSCLVCHLCKDSILIHHFSATFLGNHHKTTWDIIHSPLSPVHYIHQWPYLWFNLIDDDDIFSPQPLLLLLL